MELAIFFYVADLVDKLSTFLLIMACVLTGAGFLSAYVGAIAEIWDKAKKPCKLFCVWSIISWISFIVIPTKDTMYTMAAAYGVQTAAENPNVQRVAGKSLEVLESKLDEYLKVKDK